MATSGSTDFTQTRDNIIQQALEINKAVSIGDTPAAALVTMASAVLNQFVKFLEQAYGVRLWTLDWAQKTFSAASEVTGTDSLIYTCIRSHTSAASTKPVTGANWSTYWKQTGSTGGTWVTSTAYTSTGDFTVATDTIAIEKAFLRKDGADAPIDVVGYKEYLDIANKGDFGNPTRLWFDNKLSPTVYLSPQLDDITDVIHYLRIRRFEDFDAAGDNPDFPVHWQEPLTLGLAARITSRFDLPLQERQQIKSQADEALMLAIAGDNERIDEFRFSPRMRR